MQNSIQVKGLQKSYKQLHVLKGVDIEVEKGSIFALLGSNGSGKTTIVKILTTLLRQDGGTATVNGFDVASKPNHVRASISLTGQFGIQANIGGGCGYATISAGFTPLVITGAVKIFNGSQLSATYTTQVPGQFGGDIQLQ